MLSLSDAGGRGGGPAAGAYRAGTYGGPHGGTAAAEPGLSYEELLALEDVKVTTPQVGRGLAGKRAVSHAFYTRATAGMC
jgi:hypothetical protein